MEVEYPQTTTSCTCSVIVDPLSGRLQVSSQEMSIIFVSSDEQRL
jgi:hypothetical protein